MIDLRWPLSLVGLALIVHAIVGLSGPGRIDIDDGQARFEAGRSLVEHGDPAIRDPRVNWNNFPGRNGHEYTYYRFPQEAIAAGCILLADALGPTNEAWRHAVFSFHGAVLAGVIAVLFAMWFRGQELSPGAALRWALAGIVATPVWHYATTTFDETIGVLAVVGAMVFAQRGRTHLGWLIVAGGCVGLALNAKQPLLAILLPVLVMADDPRRCRRVRIARSLPLFLGTGLGVVAFVAYDRWKFPPTIKAEHAAIFADRFPPFFSGQPIEALLDLALGPSSGTLWYFPPILLCLAGLRAWWQQGDRGIVIATLLACAAVIAFYAGLFFYKGGVCWGPRYLTPLFALLWLFAPAGVAILGRPLTRFLIACGILVQVLSLAIIPERLYVERGLPTSFCVSDPWLYLNPAIGHLPQRPREIFDALQAPPASVFTPGPAPTFCLPVFDPPFYNGPKGIDGVRQYTLLNTFRPWWATYPALPAEKRPFPIRPMAAALLILGIGGIILVWRMREMGSDDMRIT